MLGELPQLPWGGEGAMEGAHVTDDFIVANQKIPHRLLSKSPPTETATAIKSSFVVLGACDSTLGLWFAFKG